MDQEPMLPKPKTAERNKRKRGKEQAKEYDGEA
jgi:hypothetical protein